MKKLTIVLFLIGGLLMINPMDAFLKNNAENIAHRKNFTTGIVKVVNPNNSFDVEIGDSGKIRKGVFTLSPDPDLAVEDKVRVANLHGSEEEPILLAPTKPAIVVVGDLIICCFETHKIWRCRGISSEVIDIITNISYPAGLTVANGNLISASYPYISVHDGFSEALLDQFAPPYYYINGLAFDGTNLISCDWLKKLIYIHDGLSSSILSSFASPGTFPRGLTIINGDLVSGDANSDMIYIHDGITSSIKSSFASPKPQPNGLATDGNNLISGDNGTYGVEDDLIYVHSGITLTITRSFSAPEGCLRINGLTVFE